MKNILNNISESFEYSSSVNMIDINKNNSIITKVNIILSNIGYNLYLNIKRRQCLLKFILLYLFFIRKQ